MSRTEDIEATYALSPMQEGMLFHSLYDVVAGVDTEQLVCYLHESLSLSALERAWQRVTDRHAILRTAFRWENLAAPVQEVHAKVSVPFTAEGWQGANATEVETRLKAFLKV